MSRWAAAARAVRFHRRLLSCLVLLARRQQDGVPAGATSLRHDRAGRPVGLLLLGMSVVELAAFELLVPWQTLRLVLLVLGAYSLLIVLGLLAAEAVRPHVVTGRHLLLRSGLSAQVRVPLDRVAGARAVLRTAPAERLRVDGADLVIATGGSTDVEVTLVGPMSVETSQGPEVVRTLRFAADDAAAAVHAVRRAREVGHHEGASPDGTGTARSSSRSPGPGST